jgi:hypothetical protein
VLQHGQGAKLLELLAAGQTPSGLDSGEQPAQAHPRFQGLFLAKRLPGAILYETRVMTRLCLPSLSLPA